MSELESVSSYDLLREVCAEEGLDAGELTATAERCRSERVSERESLEWDDLFCPSGELRYRLHDSDEPCRTCGAIGALFSTWLDGEDELPEPTRHNARDLYRDALPAELCEPRSTICTCPHCA